MTSATDTSTTTHVFQVWIKATPEAIWDAITKTEWTERYGYRARTHYDLRRGGAYSGKASPEMMAMGMVEDVVDGEVIEVDPPRRLVQSMNALWGEDVQAEGTSRVTWEIEPVGDSCRLTVTHDQLREGANGEVYGGWPQILSGLKTLVETGETLTTPGSLMYANAAG